MENAVSVEVQWDPDGGRCIALVQSLGSIHYQARGVRGDGGGAPAVTREAYGLGPTAGSTGVYLELGENDDIIAIQKYQGVAGAGGRTARGKAHANGTGGSRLGRKSGPCGVRDQAREAFVRRLYQLSKLRLNGREKGKGGGRVGEEEGGRHEGVDF